MSINSVLVLLEQNGLGIILLFLVGYLIFSHRKANESIKDIKGDIKEIKEGQRQFIGYMKEHEGRIANIEGRLTEKQQPPTT